MDDRTEKHASYISRRQLLIGTTAILGASAFAAGATDQALKGWRRQDDVPWKMQEVYGALFQGKAVIGGARHGLPGEPAGDHWRQQTTVFVLENGKWSVGPSLPMAQSEGVAFVRGDHIHLITGRTSLSPMSTRWEEQRDVEYHQVLDTRTGTWTFASPAPSARNSAGGGSIDGRFYLVGGRTMNGGNIARLDMYDPKEDRWRELAALPEPAGGFAATVFENRLYAFGGERLGMEGPGGVIPKSWVYDPAADRWDSLPDMLTPRHGLTAVALADRILLIGGGSLPATGRTTNVTEAYFPA